MAIVVKSGFWNDSYSFRSGNNPREKEVKRIFRKRGMKKTQELVVELLGAAAGAAALATYKRVAANGTSSSVTPVGGMGGARVIETRTQLDRVTAAADDTRLTTLITRGMHRTTKPRDLSGNGSW